jgi:hypothetical protein
MSKEVTSKIVHIDVSRNVHFHIDINRNPEGCGLSGLRRSSELATSGHRKCKTPGRLKVEMFYGEEKTFRNYEDFRKALEEYMLWYNQKRIKEYLQWKS